VAGGNKYDMVVLELVARSMKADDEEKLTI
jgi:hypothetical protein